MIKWENRQYDYIRRLDLRTGLISLGNFNRAGYGTVLPISPPEHRHNHPTKVTLDYKKKGDVHVFEITDDWGTEYVLSIEDTAADAPFVEQNKAYARDEKMI